MYLHKVPSRELIILLVEEITFPESYGISGPVTLRAEAPLLLSDDNLSQLKNTLLGKLLFKYTQPTPHPLSSLI